MSANHKGKWTQPAIAHLQTRYVICANEHIARELALMMHTNRIKIIYANEDEILASYFAYPSPLRTRYKPYSVCVDTHEPSVLFVDNLLTSLDANQLFQLVEQADATR